jgi:hypothetical protein
MGIKKNSREVNKAKNTFVKWLKNKGVECLDNDKPQSDNDWDYHCVVSGFIGESLYTVYFTVWEGNEWIDYSDEENRYDKLSPSEFLELIDYP